MKGEGPASSVERVFRVSLIFFVAYIGVHFIVLISSFFLLFFFFTEVGESNFVETTIIPGLMRLFVLMMYPAILFLPELHENAYVIISGAIWAPVFAAVWLSVQKLRTRFTSSSSER